MTDWKPTQYTHALAVLKATGKVEGAIDGIPEGLSFHDYLRIAAFQDWYLHLTLPHTALLDTARPEDVVLVFRSELDPNR